MATFAVIYHYGPDTDHRMSVRPAHREWEAGIHEQGILLAGGPLDGEAPGGLLILEAESEESLRDLLTQDPFAQEGVIERTEIRPWTPVFGPWAG
ncbi:YciI family protein [Brevibacterium litoralis]|uniref:YciI family protein n=1 Tax=Brevibacterium litoralis TaxID=3138935 RepID=UPI0032EA946A